MGEQGRVECVFPLPAPPVHTSVRNLAMPRESLPLWGSATQPGRHSTTCSFHTSGAGSREVGVAFGQPPSLEVVGIFPPWYA